jgi:hypothetical protein
MQGKEVRYPFSIYQQIEGRLVKIGELVAKSGKEAMTAAKAKLCAYPIIENQVLKPRIYKDE